MSQTPFVPEAARTQLLFRYIRALDEGDGDALSAVLDAALRDEELSRLLDEVNTFWAQEQEVSPASPQVELVRQLAERHFPAAFEAPETPAPLTVADVAAKLHAAWRANAAIARADREVAQKLLGVNLLVPVTARFEALAREISAQFSLEASDRFWLKFKNAAISLTLRGTTPQTQLALAREERTQSRVSQSRVSQSRVSKSEKTGTLPSVDTAQLRDTVRGVWSAAGLEPGPVPGIVPLSELLRPYRLAPTEVPDLTFNLAIAEVRREIGRVLETRPGAERPLAGFLYAEASDGLLLIKKDDPIARRRFTVAHELGHFLLHRSDTTLVLTEALMAPEVSKQSDGGEDSLPFGEVAFSLVEGAPGRDDLRRMEREANAFAAELLMPKEWCEQLFAAHQKQFGSDERALLRRLSSALLVSAEAMRYRLVDLGLLPPASRETP